jgi:hypothetical protein
MKIIFLLTLICVSLPNFASQNTSIQENSTNSISQKTALLKKEQIKEINARKAQDLRRTSPIQPVSIPLHQMNRYTNAKKPNF